MLVSTPVLSFQNVTKRFGDANSQPAVDQVSFSLQAGELLGLLGPSGCGKTTLLRLVAGFEQPDIGESVLAGLSVCGRVRMVPPERRRVGVVFQDYALFPHLTVVENVAFGLKQLSRRGQLPKKQIGSLAMEAINLVGLVGMEQRYPHELSGGQQQRLSIARAILRDAPILFLDEATSALDSESERAIQDAIEKLSEGKTVIAIAHRLSTVLDSDEIVVMNRGKVVDVAPHEVLLSRCEDYQRIYQLKFESD